MQYPGQPRAATTQSRGTFERGTAWPRSGSIVLCVAALAGCATSRTSVHRDLAQADRPLPRKVLLLPVEIRVHEISVGGVVEKVDDWSDQASANA